MATALVVVATVGPATAQTSPEVSVTPGLGLATVTWTPVEGATGYQIERTPMSGDQPTGPGVVVGIWSPNRGGDRITPGPLAFADHGFPVGQRYSWRVRPVIGGTPGAWSAAVTLDTPGHPGPVALLSGFEQSNGTRWTTYDEQVALLEAIAAASDRVRLETIGVTYQGRPIQLAVVGDPAPGTAEEIAETGSVLLSGTVHGTEYSGREGAMILLRELAFSDDPWVEDILSTTTVLINPTLNPDGFVNATRGNTTGQDLNRDHILLRHPENFGLAKVIRDYRPDIVVDSHENPGAGGDLEYLWPRSRAVEEDLFTFNQHVFARGHIYSTAAATGLSPAQWGTHRTDNWETLLSNTAGLKNTVGLLQEVPWRAAAAHPAEGPQGGPENQRRRTYAARWSMRTVLEYHHDNAATIRSLKAGAEAFHTANEGPVYLDGAYNIPVNPPVNEPPTAILDAPVCGYRLSAEQYAQRDGSEPGDAVQWTSATVEERLAAHGIEVEEIGSGIVQALLAQPLRPLIPYLLDPELETPVRPEGTPNISMVKAERLDDDRTTVVIDGVDSGVPNRVDDRGCTINDLIADEQEWPVHGRFVRHVVEVTSALQADGLLSAREAATIRRTVGVTPQSVRINLSGAQVPGGGHPTATAGLVLSWGQEGRVCVSRFQLRGLSASSITSVRIHAGADGVPGGPALIDLQIPPGPLDNCVSGVDPALLRAIQNAPGNYHITVTTAAYPAGAVRGQIG
jgi:hypothetical protein